MLYRISRESLGYIELGGRNANYGRKENQMERKMEKGHGRQDDTGIISGLRAKLGRHYMKH